MRTWRGDGRLHAQERGLRRTSPAHTWVWGSRNNTSVAQSPWETASRRTRQRVRGATGLWGHPLLAFPPKAHSLHAGGCDQGRASGSESPVQGEGALSKDSLDGGRLSLHLTDIEASRDGPAALGVRPLCRQHPTKLTPETQAGLLIGGAVGMRPGLPLATPVPLPALPAWSCSRRRLLYSSGAPNPPLLGSGCCPPAAPSGPHDQPHTSCLPRG